MSELLLRFLVIAPWILVLWLISLGFNGEMNGLLVFTLVVILVPLIAIINIITVVAVRGRSVLKTIVETQKQAQGEDAGSQERVQATNLADLPWYDPKRWMK